ncbi:alpha/beta fold hydrolase [Fulvivirga ligni]|uniref:alpha/beta fold hydrolase n=1 Tax=Fulvivirga ligni TaxID=2904246 RepID=UPI001F3936A4|nr:alpha/beta fold hydrolase [Fulvivirga ligni]UII19001.1 alpha/beta fold hydrolase [Fulvivirga ligni]
MKIIKRIALLLMLVFTLNACADDDSPSKSPSTFVLVHGAWQASFVWDKLKADLEKEGHKVVKIELLGHGEDQTPVSEITFDGYVAQVTAAIEALNTPVILVGHSLGGAIVTQAASKVPKSIDKLVYVAGFIPKSGSSVFEYSGMDEGTSIPSALEFSEDGSTVTIAHPEVNMREIFCQYSSDEDIHLLVEKLRPEPVTAAGTPLNYSAETYAGISNKYYVFTTKDQAISYPFQQQMAKEANITNTYEIEAGHSPFLSKPDELVQIFNTILEK